MQKILAEKEKRSVLREIEDEIEELVHIPVVAPKTKHIFESINDQ